jgi:RimJ/RimL family protein N-acetyltransferase
MPELNAYGQLVGDVVPGWAPRMPPEPVRLEGRYVGVEPLTVHQAPELFEALCRPGDGPLWTYRTTEPPADVTGMGSLIADTLAAPDSVTFALVPAGGTPSGVASLMRTDLAAGSVEVGAILLGRSVQRTRAATESIHLLMRHAFDGLGYRRLEWKCDALNEPSRRAACRLGFSFEGRFRSHLVTKGRNRDTDWFSVTDHEWPEVRAAHERWLEPSNFDAGGQQRVSLSSLTTWSPWPPALTPGHRHG